MRRFAACAALLLVWAPLSPLVHTAGAQSSPRLISTECRLAGVPAAALDRLRCATVEVPRVYGDTNTSTFKLAVTIVRSARQPPHPDPVVLIPGGPGETLTGVVVTQAADPKFVLALDRDLILFDPRGTGQSEPRVCSTQSPLRWWAPDRTKADLALDRRDTERACLDEARRGGISPESFGTDVAVEDVEQIRQAVGVEQWNAIGISYGTLPGRELARRYPQTLRSLTLDSVTWAGALPVPLDLDMRFERALHAVAAECAGSPACARSYPDLWTAFDRASKRLDADPLVVPMPAELRLPGNQVILNRADLEQVAFAALYDGGASLPAIIRGINDGRLDELPAALTIHAQGFEAISLFAFLAITCRDDGGGNFLSSRGQAATAIHAIDPSAGCGEWTTTRSTLGSATDTRVPTLVLAGMLDPITPPIFGRSAAEALGKAATFVQLPSIGHATIARSGCALALVGAFLTDPAAQLDRSCVADSPSVVFR